MQTNAGSNKRFIFMWCIISQIPIMQNAANLPREWRWSARSAEAGEPTGAREHVCGPDVILTTSVKGAREISAGRSPLAKQVARAVRARQNHAGGAPANCGSGEQVGRRPLFSLRTPPTSAVGCRPLTNANYDIICGTHFSL